MPTISEDTITELLEGGNAASAVVPDAVGGFVKLSYLWGKLRVDKCDKDGKIILTASRGGGGAIPLPPSP